MKKSILQLGKALTRKEQSEINGGGIITPVCSSVSWGTVTEVWHDTDCMCYFKRVTGFMRGTNEGRVSPEQANCN